MGGLVTEIAGSVGGSTFRRSKSGIQLYNKVFGNSYSQNSKNQALSRLNFHIQKWSTLTPSDQALWNTQASRFQRTDRFGNTVNYTGRELWIAVQNNISDTSISVSDPANISSIVPIPDIGDVEIISRENCNVDFDNANEGDYAVLQVQILAYEGSAPVFKRYKILAKVELTASNQIDFNSYVSDESWYSSPGTWVCFWLSYINDSGWRSSAVPFVTMVQAP